MNTFLKPKQDAFERNSVVYIYPAVKPVCLSESHHCSILEKFGVILK